MLSEKRFETGKYPLPSLFKCVFWNGPSPLIVQLLTTGQRTDSERTCYGERQTKSEASQGLAFFFFGLYPTTLHEFPQGGNKVVYILFGCVERAHPAHHVLRFIPVVEEVLLL